MFWWKKSEKSESKKVIPKKVIKKTWVGAIPASYDNKKSKLIWEFWYQLYEDDKGNRTCEVTGRWPLDNHPFSHCRYSQLVVPFLNTPNQNSALPNVWASLETWNVGWWSKHQDVIDAVKAGGTPKNNKPPEKPKHEFKLLKFPKPEDDEKKAGPQDGQA